MWGRIESAWIMHGACMGDAWRREAVWPDRTRLPYHGRAGQPSLQGYLLYKRTLLGLGKTMRVRALWLGRYPERWKDGALPTAFKKSKPPTSPPLGVVDNPGSHRGRG